jgi:uncharacterized low-complexity protein
MKRIPILAALVACLTIGMVSTAHADTIGSTLKVKYKPADPADPYGTSKFKGTVGPKKCAKNRKVTIKGLGSEKTDARGKFDFTLSRPADPGRYKVKVAEKSIGGGDTCSKVKTTLTIQKAG